MSSPESFSNGENTLAHFADKVRQVATRATLAATLLMSGAVTADIVSSSDTLASADTGGYPDADAREYNRATYDWWVDENGNGRADVTSSPTDDDEAMSPRGYYYKNCTDYVAWKVLSTQGIHARGLGHAKNWDDNAKSRGFTWDYTPEAGDAAVSESGTYGHVMFVERVNSNGSVVVSDYNKQGTGEYLGPRTISAANLKFVDFNGTGKGINGAPAPSQPYNGVTAISSQFENGTHHVYWATADGTLRETWFRPGVAHTNVIRKFGSAVTALSSQYSPHDQVQHVYAGTMDGTIYETWFGPNSGGYQTWQAHDTDSPILAMSSEYTPDGTQHIYWGTLNGRVGETWFRPGAVNSWEAFRSNSPVRALSDQYTPDGIQHVYWGNDEGRLHETWFRPGTVYTNLMADFPYPILSVDSQTGPNGSQHIYSGDLDGKVRETWFSATSAGYNTWEAAALGSPVKVLSSEYTPDGDQHIYTGAGGKLRETWFHPGVVNSWEAANSPVEITAISDQYTTADGFQHVFWGGADGKVRETYFKPGVINHWQLPS